MNILDEIKQKLKNKKIKIVNHEIDAIKTDGGELIRYRVHVDFSITTNESEINEIVSKMKKGLFDRLKKKNPVQSAYEYYVEYLTNFLSQVYGISYDRKGKDNFAKIYSEGGRIA
jgi:hypothetical protein